MKSLLGGADAADIVAWAEDANNAVTSKARKNSANALLAARAEERQQKVKNQKRELEESKRAIVVWKNKAKKLKREKTALENENVALRNGLQGGVAAQFDGNSD